VGTRAERQLSADPGHLACPFCSAYEVERLYLASLALDSCVCTICGARWDEDATSGEFRGRASSSSVMTPRET
jgi:hypothetical protein